MVSKLTNGTKQKENIGHASPELTETLAETLDLEAKQVKLMSFTTLCIIIYLKKVYLVYFITYY